MMAADERRTAIDDTLKELLAS